MASKTRGDAFGFEEATAERWLGLVRTALWPYFRPHIIGAEHLPQRGRAMIVGCHYGVIPYDTACALTAIHEATGRFARAVGDNFFASIPAVERFLHRVGAVVGRPDVLERILRAGHMVLVIPGGAKDSARRYLTQRYHALPIRGFAPGRGGYVKIALRTRSPIIPFAAVGGEEAHVMLGTVPFVDRLLGVPFLPVVLFPLPLPTKLYIRFGEPMRLPGTPADADDQRTVDELNTLVRKQVQHLIDDTLRHRQGIVFSTYVGRQPQPRRSRVSSGARMVNRTGAAARS